MHHFTAKQIQELEKIYRLNLINSCTGYRSANLIGSKSSLGITNLAIFNSVTHIGSNPPLLGFIERPLTVRRDTYNNIKETGYFTVNHITSDMIKQAHQCSAKYDKNISEFERTGLQEEYLDAFFAPYVMGAPVRIGCKYVNEYPIKENDTILIVASIENLYIQPNILDKDGWLKLDKANVVTITGLDGYSLPSLLERFPYARP